MIKEFFVDCPIPDMSRFTSGLLKTAMQTIYDHEKKPLLDYINEMEKGNITDYIMQSCGDKIESHKSRVSPQQQDFATATPTSGVEESPLVYTPS